MKKYNLSNIMKRAWELVKKIGCSISDALKKAWSEVKSMKARLIQRMEMLAEKAEGIGDFHYTVKVNDWENYGKSRTYFSIIRTRETSSHRSEIKFGYYDNQSEKYVPGNGCGCDLTENYDLSGSKTMPDFI